MTPAEPLAQWLEEPSVEDESWAIFWVLVALLVPTLVRASISGIVEGCHTIPFVPSVLLAAIFLEWRYAAVVALGSALLSDLLFIGHDRTMFGGACDIFGVGLFLFASALIIASVELPRQIHNHASRAAAPDNEPAGIIFSLEGGQAFASWYGQGSPVRLGPQGEVAEMMKDFLAQLEVARRLANHRG